MESLITDTQKMILHKAVDTGNAEFIARCIVTIEEIIECIKTIFTLNDRSTSPAPAEQENNHGIEEYDEGAAEDPPDKGLVTIKIEKEPSIDETAPPTQQLGTAEEPSVGQATANLNTTISDTGDGKQRASSKKKNKKAASEQKSSNGNENDRRKPFVCQSCDYSTHRKYRLDDHINRKHNSHSNNTVEALSPNHRWESVDNHTTDTYQPSEQLHTSTQLADNSLHTSTQLEDNSLHTSAQLEDNSLMKTKCIRRKCAALHCTECDHVAATKAALKKHMVSEHPSMCETIKCPHCEFTTKKRPNYRQHMKTHLAPEDKPHRCAQCSYSSANKEGLQIHLNSAHKGVKPYLCDTCGQSFTGISMLSKHKLMKHKPKHLSCPHCDYKTSLQTWLKDHMKRHSTETPFICQFCSYAAKTSGRLKVHLRIHTGERPYKCHLCEYGAMEGAPLKKHLKNQHQLSVSRIDVREGKLFMTNGDVLETGLGTRTLPLPPGSFHGPKARQDGVSEDDQSLTQPPLSHIADTPGGIAAGGCIISQAASLSALPVQPESPGGESDGDGLAQFTHLLGVPQQYQLPHPLANNTVLPVVSHGHTSAEHDNMHHHS